MIIELEALITEVTVFQDRARVSRTGHTSLEPGNHRIIIKGLPLSLEADSIRVRAQGTARAKIQGVDVGKVFYKDTPPGNVSELLEELEGIENNLKKLQDQADTFNTEINHLDGLANSTQIFAAGLAKGRMSSDSHIALLDSLSSRRTNTLEQLHNNNIQQRHLNDERQLLQNRLKQLQEAQPKERFQAAIEIDVRQAGDLEIKINYMFWGARWYPLYDIRLLDSHLEIQYLAEIIQSSGENWENVSMTLSTARPAVSTTVPELNPWFLFPVQTSPRGGNGLPIPPPAAPMPAQLNRMKKLSSEMDVESILPGGIPEAEPAIMATEISTASISQVDTFVTYKLGENINLPGDGSPHKNTIGSFRLTPMFDYVTAPKLETAAYRRIKVINDSQFMLLPGKAQLFINDDFIGSTQLKLTTTGEKLILYFGTDDRFRVKRELTNRETDKKFMADKRRLRFAYLVRLENYTGEPQTITVFDQIPIPRHEHIKVKLEETEPKVNDKDQFQRMKWEIPIKAGETREIRYDFSVEYPQEMNIRGLP